MLTILVAYCPHLSDVESIEGVRVVRQHGGETLRRGDGLIVAAFGTRVTPEAEAAVRAAWGIRAGLKPDSASRYTAVVVTMVTEPEPSVESLDRIPPDVIEDLARGAPKLARRPGVLVHVGTEPHLPASIIRRPITDIQGVGDYREVVDIGERNEPASQDAAAGLAGLLRDVARLASLSPKHAGPARSREIGVLNSVAGSALEAMKTGRQPMPVPQMGPQTDDVVCTVFAPPHVSAGGAALVQVFAHRGEDALSAAAQASEFDADATRRAVRTLETEVTRGDRLTFALAIPGAVVDEPVQTLRWIGDPEAVQFGISVPASTSTSALIGTVTVSLATVPIGHIKFRLGVTAAGIGAASTAAASAAAPSGEAARAYSTAFISYASSDRDRVLARAQMLEPLGIRFFQDVVDLQPGQRWEEELRRRINECDVFLLFWSTAAKGSEWVQREVAYALDRQRTNPDALPAIVPVILEGPPVVPPPENLAHLHFNDRLIYFMRPDDRQS